MDRKQMIVQRVREFFGDRLDDVCEMVRQDRQDLRGWQEPAHVRSVLRRQQRAESEPPFPLSSPNVLTERVPLESDLERTAGEPDRVQQREATGLLLEVAVNGLEKIARGPAPDLTSEETLGLECVLLIHGRPAIQITANGLGNVPPTWNILEDQREQIEQAQSGVGRIELLGHPEYDWAGTGFLVGETVLMTTRRVAELFIENRSNTWQFRPGMSTWMNYRSGYQGVAGAGYRVRNVIGVHDRYDLALLEVERPQVNGTAPQPLSLAIEAPQPTENRPVYLIGYPVRDARRNEPEAISRIFRDVYNVKRVQPGMLQGELNYHEVTFLRHDAGPLGQNSGAPLLDLETNQVLAMQSTGRYLETNTAVPLYLLREDPLLRSANVLFSEASPADRQRVLEQVEQLARSRYWSETRTLIANLYQRAFGTTDWR